MDYRLHKEPLPPLAVLVLTLTVAQSADSSCAAFHFPSVVNDTVISQENTTLTLPFEVTSTLNTFYCNESLKNFTIDVVKWDNKTLSTVCSIQHDSNGDCVSGSIKDTPCECGQEPRTYRLVKTLGRADSKAWGWKTSNDLAKSKKIVFNVTLVIYKPKDTTRPTDQGFGRQSRQASSRTQRSSHMYMVPDDEAEPSLSLRDFRLSRDSWDHGQHSENIHRARAAALRTNQQQRLAGVDTQEMISFTRGREEPKITQQDNQRRIKLPDLTFGPGAVSTEVLKPGAKWCLNVQIMLEPMPADGSLGLASRSRQSAAPYERLLPVTGESARTMSSDAADQSHDDSSESEKHCADASPDLASKNRQSASPYECLQPITEESARAMSSDADQSHDDSSGSEKHSAQGKRLEKVHNDDDVRSVASDSALELFPQEDKESC
ncbi:hypothetical protein BaRGS_00027025 [Batillaria attramentaria]|uniref:Uncharacterized protein n=1 Tax=Batillaria attramentaria TaxID=370345 RepID=A0ABD0K2Z8_9CAEN